MHLPWTEIGDYLSIFVALEKIDSLKKSTKTLQIAVKLCYN
jgi:hypothetical protein